MQSDLNYNMPKVPPSNSNKTAQDIFPMNKNLVLQAVEVEDRSHRHYRSDDQVNIEKVPSGLPIGEQGRRQRWIPSSTTWRLLLLTGDTLLIASLLALVLLFVPSLHLNLRVASFSLKTWDMKLAWAALSLVSWSIAVTITQAQEMANATSRFKSPLSVLLALILMFIFWMGLTWLFIDKEMLTPVRMEQFFLVLAGPTLCTWRFVLAECMRLPRFLPQAVIVGINAAGETIAREIRDAKHSSTTVLGYIGEKVDAAPTYPDFTYPSEKTADTSTPTLGQAGRKREGSWKDGLPILGDRSVLRHMTQSGMVDMIIMALDYKAHPELFQVSIEAAQLGISVVPMPVIYEHIGGKIPVEHLGDQWYGALPSERRDSPLYMCWRKAMDVAFGLFGTTVLLLVLPIVALLIYLDSPGPIFYKQERVGYQGRIFSILKFRSMRTDAESSGHAVWAAEADARVTRIGRFMRATHLDELPQALNILGGEMSLIGPRPERQVFVEQLARTIPFYRCRLSVKPGLTGWAQIKYSYTSSIDDTLLKLQYDLYYIKHQSFTLDLFIVLKTVVEVLFCRGR